MSRSSRRVSLFHSVTAAHSTPACDSLPPSSNCTTHLPAHTSYVTSESALGQKGRNGRWPRRGHCQHGYRYFFLDSSSPIVRRDRRENRQTDRHETDALRFPPRICEASVITRVLVYMVGQKSKLLYCDRYRACFADIMFHMVV